jgi:hypothetical protein
VNGFSAQSLFRVKMRAFGAGWDEGGRIGQSNWSGSAAMQEHRAQDRPPPLAMISNRTAERLLDLFRDAWVEGRYRPAHLTMARLALHHRAIRETTNRRFLEEPILWPLYQFDPRWDDGVTMRLLLDGLDSAGAQRRARSAASLLAHRNAVVNTTTLRRHWPTWIQERYPDAEYLLELARPEGDALLAVALDKETHQADLAARAMLLMPEAFETQLMQLNADSLHLHPDTQVLLSQALADH